MILPWFAVKEIPYCRYNWNKYAEYDRCNHKLVFKKAISKTWVKPKVRTLPAQF